LFHHLRIVYLLIGTLTIFYLINQSSIFTFSDRFIYNKISPYLHNKFHNNTYILIDAYSLNDTQIVKLIDIIEKNSPKKIIADIFHCNTTKIINRHRLILAIPSFISIDKESSKSSTFRYHLYNNFDYKSNNNQDFIINFNGKIDSANIYADSILNRYVEDTIFNNSIVIISNFNNNYSFNSLLPFKKKEFAHQKYLMYLYNTVSHNIWLKFFRGYRYYLFIIIYILISAFFIYIFYEYAITTAIAIIAIIFASYYISVSFFYILLPITEMLFLLFFIFTYLVYYREITIIIRENRLNRNISLSLDKKNVYTSFFNSRDSWIEISNIIQELFMINKSIFLEKIDNKIHLKEIYSLNCSLDDIFERRRDYTREPYLSAVKSRKAIIIDRQFFKTKNSNEYEIVAPLIYYNDILGFWVFSIDKQNIENIDTLLEEVTLCSTEIARLLFEKNKFLQNRIRNQKRVFINKIIDFIHIEIDNSSAQNIEKNFTILLKKFYTKDVIFNKTENSIILYDFFGRVISANNNIEKLSKHKGINLYSLNATNFLHKISNIPYPKSIDIIRSVIYHQNSYEDIICISDNQRYLIRISPITKDNISNKFNENFFMGVYGILFEMIDLGVVDILSIPIINMTKKYIKDSDSKIIKLNKILNKTNDIEEGKALINTIHKSYYIAYNALDSNCKNINNRLSLVNILYLIEFLTNTFANKYIDIDVDIDSSQIKNIEAFTYINIKEFSMYMIDILRYLSHSKTDNIRLEIGFKRFKEWSMIYIKNNSSFIPKEDLIKSLKLESKNISFKTLKEEFKKFHMEIDIDSDLIDGITVKLFFKESKIYE